MVCQKTTRISTIAARIHITSGPGILIILRSVFLGHSVLGVQWPNGVIATHLTQGASIEHGPSIVFVVSLRAPSAISRGRATSYVSTLETKPIQICDTDQCPSGESFSVMMAIFRNSDLPVLSTAPNSTDGRLLICGSMGTICDDDIYAKGTLLPHSGVADTVAGRLDLITPPASAKIPGLP